MNSNNEKLNFNNPYAPPQSNNTKQQSFAGAGQKQNNDQYNDGYTQNNSTDKRQNAGQHNSNYNQGTPNNGANRTNYNNYSAYQTPNYGRPNGNGFDPNAQRQNGYNPNGRTPNGYNPNVNNPNGFVRTFKKVYDNCDKLFAWFAIALGFLFILLIGSVWFRFGLGATIFFVASSFASYFYVAKRGIKIDLVHNISFIFLVVLSLSFLFFSNTLALWLDFLVLTFGLIYWIYTTGGKDRKKEGGVLSEMIISCFAYPFMSFGSLFSAIFKHRENKKQGNGKWIFLGLLIAFPIVCIVSSLLIMSDEMFKAMFSFLFDNFFGNIVKYLWFAVLGLPIAMGIFSVWYTKYFEGKKIQINNQPQRINNNTTPFNCHVAPVALMYSIAIPLCVVYFLYLISQVAYFISFIADNLLPEGFTIVDYARNGFFELCVVTVINIVLIILLITLTKRPQGVMPVGLRVISVLMSLFTLVFVGTALYKMFMYIGQYGFTSMRINTSIFMVFLLIIFMLIIAKQFLKEIKFFATALIVAMVFLAGYNLLDVDAFIARENINLYQQGRIEWMGNEMVTDLDDSALEYIAPFANDPNNGLSETESEHLKAYMRYRYNKYEEQADSNDERFAMFNINRYRVHCILAENGFDEYTEDDMYSRTYGRWKIYCDDNDDYDTSVGYSSDYNDSI